MSKHYLCYAIFLKEKDGYSVRFPYVDGAFTCGDNFEEALLMAKDCLELNFDIVEKIPKIFNIEDIQLQKDELVVLFTLEKEEES